jgi:Holliday junction resolvase YEN1
MHVMVYRAEDLEKDPACRLTRGGMILIGLLSGGDYDQVRRLFHYQIVDSHF